MRLNTVILCTHFNRGFLCEHCSKLLQNSNEELKSPDIYNTYNRSSCFWTVLSYKRLNTQARGGNPPPTIFFGCICATSYSSIAGYNSWIWAKSHDSAPHHNNIQKWTCSLPPFAHQHPCLCFQENSHCHMF